MTDYTVTIEESSFDVTVEGDTQTVVKQIIGGPHTHALSDLWQSGATTGQVVAWNGTAWAPATVSGGGGVADGDKGDIVVSGGGAVWSLDYTTVNATIAPTWANVTGKPSISGTNTGDETAAGILAKLLTVDGAGSGLDADLLDGQSAAAFATAAQANATHTGDATGSTVLTLATVNSNVGSFGLAASIAQFTVNAKGLITAAANVAISIAATAISDATAAGRAMLTAATATAQTALLDVFTSGAKGLAPASGGGTTNFLRADGTWAAAGGGVDLTTAQTVAGVKTFSDTIGMAAQTSTPAAPASGVLIYGQSVAGMLAAKVRGVSNRAAVLQNALWDRRTVQFCPTNAQGTILGSAYTTSGDVVYNVGQSTTSAYSACARSAWRNVATTANQSMGFVTTTAFFRGNAAGVGGFFFHARAGFESWTNGGRMFVGMGTGGGDVSNEPGFLFKGCGFVIESGDAGLISFMTRSGYNTNTKVSTGLTAVTGKGYDFHIFCEPNTSQITWMIRDVNTGTEVSGTATTNLWTNTVDAAMSVYAGNAALTTVGAINFSVASAYAEVVGG